MKGSDRNDRGNGSNEGIEKRTSPYGNHEDY